MFEGARRLLNFYEQSDSSMLSDLFETAVGHTARVKLSHRPLYHYDFVPKSR